MLDIHQFINYKQHRSCYSQLGQDLFALWILGEKRNGYFVEFGATDGIEKSNTFLLEKQYGWTGILCEPAKQYHKFLLANRSCHKDFRCVSSSTGQNLSFRDCKFGELSCIDSYTKNDSWAWNRVDAKIYDVESVSLNDLLSQYNAPHTIDYISIDTEGSEFDILNSLDFKYDILVMSVEHNHTENKSKIIQLLERNNFINVFPEITDFDSWFVNKNVYNQ